MEPQPHALAQTLNVVLETCREWEKLIGMLTQKNNQEKIVKLSEACHCCKGCDQPCLLNKVILSAVCYCCVGYDRPCLQNLPTIWTSMYNQGFGENSQSSLILPSVSPREENQHMMEIPAQVNNVPDMDLSGRDITCLEFRPRKCRPARKPKGAGTKPTPPPATELVKKKHYCFNCGRPGNFSRLCKFPRQL